MPAAKLRIILDRSLCPEVLFEDNYDDFIAARVDRLLEAARSLME